MGGEASVALGPVGRTAAGEAHVSTDGSADTTLAYCQVERENWQTVPQVGPYSG
jgi:hypothetical protein